MRGFRSRRAGAGGSHRPSREEAEAEAAAELRRVMEQAGVPTAAPRATGPSPAAADERRAAAGVTPSPPVAPPRAEAAPDPPAGGPARGAGPVGPGDPPGDAPSTAVRRVRKSPPGARPARP